MRLSFAPVFCLAGINPYSTVQWVERSASVTAEDGGTLFEQRDVRTPAEWSDMAVNVVVSKYFRGHPGTPERETGVDTLIHRVVDTITEWGVADGYFSTDADAEAFSADLAWLCLHQHLAFNSPVWFNVGAEEKPQCSACFINSVEDTMESILGLARTEGMLFKWGSGAGSNLSPIRSSKERLRGGGTASGPVSFMRGFDSFAGVIKSGGKTRRAAKMVILDIGHPDVVDFIRCKEGEEEKAHVLIDAGYDGGFNVPGGAYDSVFFQNANHSVRVTDEFMLAVEADGDWHTRAVTTGEVLGAYKARRLMSLMSEAAWKCGDPGVQFDTTINAWHTCPNTDRIYASNPCQPAFATVLTPDGIRTFADIDVGSTIWSGKQWTKVTAKWSTGIKPVQRYQTTAGAFIGTKNHRVVSRGEKHEVGTVDAIDAVIGCRYVGDLTNVDRSQSVMDGLVIGDGGAKTVNNGANTYMILYVGQDDQSYFDSEIKSCIGVKFDGIAHRVTTTITAEELPATYLRRVPARYLHADYATVAAFLRGLYSANGSICGGRVTLKAASFGMINDVQLMLSALGIRSYYTTNPAHRVTFANGEYDCRESYDLNITTDRDKFADMIGFIQPEKTIRLNEALQIAKAARGPKVTYDIISIDHLGDHEVFDITVEAEEHTYWTGGLLVSNCSEYMFLNDTACNLASLNLMRFRESDGSFNVDRFTSAVRIAITAQEILVGRAAYPTPTIEKNSHDYRPLGLGYANLGALLMADGRPYDSQEAQSLAAAITSLMTATAYHQSAVIASVCGPFAGFEANREPMLAVVGKHIDATTSLYHSLRAESAAVAITEKAVSVWAKALQLGRAHGYRHSQVTVLAPTGTIGFMLDCATTGIEPDIALIKYKKMVGGGYMKIVNQTVGVALERLGYSPAEREAILAHLAQKETIEGAPGLKSEDLPVFDCAFKPANGERSLSPMSHIRMMAAVQPFLSGAISKTVNVPGTATAEDIGQLYMEAWKAGLKSVAIYRDGCKRTQPLNTARSASKAEPKPEAPAARRRLPSTRHSLTHKFEIAGHEGYVTVGLYDDGAPGEIFVRMAKEGSTLSGLLDDAATSMSLALQYGVPLHVLTSKKIGSRFEPSGFTGNPDIPFALSIVDYIGRWLDLTFGEGARPEPYPVSAPVVTAKAPAIDASGPPCTDCGSLTVRSGSCYRCTNCGSSTGCGG